MKLAGFVGSMICGEDSGWLSRVLDVVLKVRELAGAWPAGTEEWPKSRTVNQTGRYGTPQTDYSRLSPEQTPIVSRAGHHHRHLDRANCSTCSRRDFLLYFEKESPNNRTAMLHRQNNLGYAVPDTPHSHRADHRHRYVQLVKQTFSAYVDGPANTRKWHISTSAVAHIV